jgi:hypothetical protein
LIWKKKSLVLANHKTLTHIESGYPFANVDFKPRVAPGFEYASGDGNPNDKEHDTFVNLYPTNHKVRDFVAHSFTAKMKPRREGAGGAGRSPTQWCIGLGEG